MRLSKGMQQDLRHWVVHTNIKLSLVPQSDLSVW